MKNQNSQNKILGGGEPNLRSKFGAKEFYFGCFGFFLVIVFLLFIPSAQAQSFLQGIVPCGTSYTGNTPCTVCHFYKLLQNIINFLLYTSASLATLMAVYIGFLFLLSGGSQKIITNAKSKLWLLVWGIGWVLGSWLILNTILTFLVDSKVFPLPWNQISCEVSRYSGEVNNIQSQTSSQTPTLPKVPTVPTRISLNKNTRLQLIALTSFLLQHDTVFAGEVEKLLKKAESSPTSHNFFLEINGINPAPSIILSREEGAWIKSIEIHGLSHSFLASIISQFAQKFFPGVRAASVSISSVAPQNAAPGSTVVIKGVGFSPTDNTFNLTFPDGTVAIYNNIPSQDNGTIIQGVVPQSIIIGGHYTFFISNENGISNTATLDIIVDAANFVVNQIDVAETEGTPVSPDSLATITDNEDGSTTVSATIAGSSLSVTVSPNGNVSLSLTDPEGLTTNVDISGVTVAPNGNITGQITATTENGQTVTGTVTVSPEGVVVANVDNTIDALSGPSDNPDAPQPSNTEGEGPGGGVDAGGGAGLGGTGAGESDGGSTSDGAPDSSGDASDAE